MPTVLHNHTVGWTAFLNHSTKPLSHSWALEQLLPTRVCRTPSRYVSTSWNHIHKHYRVSIYKDLWWQQQCEYFYWCNIRNGTTISEGYLMRYGISLLSHPWAWEVACDYFTHCGPFAHGLTQEVCDSILLFTSFFFLFYLFSFSFLFLYLIWFFLEYILTIDKVVDRQQVIHDSKFEKIQRVVRSYRLAPTPALRSYAMYLHSKRRYLF